MKIFLTVGSMLPFDRLVRAMDEWAYEHPEAQVFAQIGKTSLRPLNMECHSMISLAEYRDHFANCDLVVSHVGMGTVITALECSKPLVMLPRRPELNEVTSNHQFATAKWLKGSPGVRVVYSENELASAIFESFGSDGVSMIETGTHDKLIDALRQFVANCDTRNTVSSAVETDLVATMRKDGQSSCVKAVSLTRFMPIPGKKALSAGIYQKFSELNNSLPFFKSGNR